jgi:predicted SprT family Zn-dependent metalloprotease
MRKRYGIVATNCEQAGEYCTLRGLEMHEQGNILSLRFATPAIAHASRTPAQLTFCYQCHCAVDLGASRTALRSGHWARVGTCAHCGTTITRILKAS